MSRRIQSKVFAFDEVKFLTKLGTRTIILKVTRFISIVIVGFDPTIVEINDTAIGVINVGFFMRATLWLKTCSNVNG
jgi:hypothetical protein